MIPRQFCPRESGGDDEVIFGDASYVSDSYKRGACALGLQKEGRQQSQMAWGNPEQASAQGNWLAADDLARVEHIFRVIKCPFGYPESPLPWFKKRTLVQVMVKMVIANMYLQRHALMAA